MQIQPTALAGVFIIEPKIFGDERGHFFESYSTQRLATVCPLPFVQDNESRSVHGVIRGLHYQRAPHAQSKLVRVVRGAVLDVAVDIRRGSPTFGQHVSVELSEHNHRQLFIPRGFAHGFSVLSDEAILQYKCDDYYAPETEGTILWSDPTLAIDWRLSPEEVIVSPRDAIAKTLSPEMELFDYHTDYYDTPAL